MKVINEQEFNEITKHNGLVLVDFFATWCGPCKMLGPVLEDVANDFAKEVTIVKLDVDQEPNLAMKYGVMSVPTMLLFKDGELVDKLEGFKSKPQLETTFKKHI